MYIINLIVFDKNNVYAYGIPNQEIRYPKTKDAWNHSNKNTKNNKKKSLDIRGLGKISLNIAIFSRL